MEIHLNEKMIARRAKIGRYASTGGLIVLVLGMVATFRGPQYTWISFGCLLVGLVASQVGTYHMRRWGRSPRPDEVLTRSLKGLDKRYHFFAWLLPASYVLLGPAGVFTFVTKDQTGEVEYKAGRWRQPFSWMRLLTIFAGEGLGDPEREVAGQTARLGKLIVEKLGEETAAQVPLQGIVTFVADDVQLNLEGEPGVPVLPVKKLKDHVRGEGRGEKLPADLRQKLLSALEA